MSCEELGELSARARSLDPQRLIAASHAGGDITAGDVERYIKVAQVDFLTPHRPRDADSPGRTAELTRETLKWARDAGKEMPVHYQEPFRRDFSPWQPMAEDFLADLRGAVEGGAAGWCLHNGSPRGPHRNRQGPRRSFDLRPEHGRMMDQLDEEELEVIRRAKECLGQ